MVSSGHSREEGGVVAGERRAPGISAVVAAWNEESGLLPVCQALLAVLERQACDFEIIIVDDGSRDWTARVAAACAALSTRVSVVTHPENQGLGAVIRSGLAAAAKDWVVFLPADGQFDPGELAGFLPHCDSTDLVCGYRSGRAPYGPFRKVLSAVNRLLHRALFGLRVRDPNWVVLFRRSLIADAPIVSRSSFIQGELLIRALRRGATVREIPTGFLPRAAGQAKLGNLASALRALRDLVAFRLRAGRA